MIISEMVFDSKPSLGNGSMRAIDVYCDTCAFHAVPHCLYHSVINRLYRVYGKRNIRLESVPLKGSSLDPR